MIGNKPSIYNAQSVYNQGGGGSSFEVVVNDVTNTLFFPAFLMPVEYIDLANFSDDTNFCILGSEQIHFYSNSSTYKTKMVFECKAENISARTTKRIFGMCPAFDFNNNYEIQVNIEKTNNGDANFTGVYGRNYCGFYGIPFPDGKRCIYEVNAPSRTFKLKVEGGATYTSTDSRSYPTRNIGHLMVFNYQTQTNSVFKGKFYYSYIVDGNNKIVSIVIPAKSKDPNDTKPYIVECVGGSVSINCSQNLSTSGIEFGPEIDLDNIQQYFE